MLPICAIPDEIKGLIEPFRRLFRRREQWLNFQKYITGLITVDKGNIKFMSDHFVGVLKGDQSALNRFLTDSHWDENALNEMWIDIWKNDPKIGITKEGIIALDDFTTKKTGKHMQGVGKFYDFGKGCYHLGHCFVSSTYYRGQYTIPLYTALYVKKADIGKLQSPIKFKKKTQLSMEMIDRIVNKGIEGVFAFDVAYLCKDVTEKIEGHKRVWISKAKCNTRVQYKRKWTNLGTLAEEIKQKKKYQAVDVHNKWYYVWSACLKVSKIGKRKIFIVWLNCNTKNTPYFLVTNATWWEEKKAISMYNGRWAEEILHRDEKQELGLGDYQVRGINAIQRHVTSARFVHWLLMNLATSCPVRDFEDNGSSKRLTVGSLVRLIKIKALWKFLETILETLENGNKDDIDNLLCSIHDFTMNFVRVSKTRVIVN